MDPRSRQLSLKRGSISGRSKRVRAHLLASVATSTALTTAAAGSTAPMTAPASENARATATRHIQHRSEARILGNFWPATWPRVRRPKPEPVRGRATGHHAPWGGGTTHRGRGVISRLRRPPWHCTLAMPQLWCVWLAAAGPPAASSAPLLPLALSDAQPLPWSPDGVSAIAGMRDSSQYERARGLCSYLGTQLSWYLLEGQGRRAQKGCRERSLLPHKAESYQLSMHEYSEPC